MPHFASHGVKAKETLLSRTDSLKEQATLYTPCHSLLNLSLSRSQPANHLCDALLIPFRMITFFR
jgi:hypothetical protein